MRIAKKQDMAALQRVLTTLFQLLHEGIFPYAPDSAFCRFCEYQCVCGGSERANERIKMKLEDHGASHTAIESFRRLIDCDD
jgi:hypothetical protein